MGSWGRIGLGIKGFKDLFSIYFLKIFLLNNNIYIESVE